MRYPANIITLSATLALLGTTSAGGAQVSVNGSTYYERSVGRGESYVGSLSIGNSAPRPGRARVYVTDYRFDPDGVVQFPDAGTLPRSNARWISLSTTEITVPAHGAVPVSYTIRVPAADTLSGSYWSVIMVEELSDAARDAPRGTGELVVHTAIRYAVQIVSHVGASAERRFDIVDPHVAPRKSGGDDLIMDLKNTGQRAASIKVSVELYDENGAKRGAHEAKRGVVYPGLSVRQTFDLGPLPSGSYKTLITIDAGDGALFAAQFTMKR